MAPANCARKAAWLVRYVRRWTFGRVLTITGMSRGVRLNGGDIRPLTQPDRFKISGIFRLPAGATGTFILPRQMPPPEGEAAAACELSRRARNSNLDGAGATQ